MLKRKKSCLSDRGIRNPKKTKKTRFDRKTLSKPRQFEYLGALLNKRKSKSYYFETRYGKIKRKVTPFKFLNKDGIMLIASMTKAESNLFINYIIPLVEEGYLFEADNVMLEFIISQNQIFEKSKIRLILKNLTRKEVLIAIKKYQFVVNPTFFVPLSSGIENPSTALLQINNFYKEAAKYLKDVASN